MECQLVLDLDTYAITWYLDPMKKFHKASEIHQTAPFVVGPAAQWHICNAAFFERGAVHLGQYGECMPVGTKWSWVKELDKRLKNQ